MDGKILTKLKTQPFWSWLPGEGSRYFDACFDMTTETIPAGEHRESRGRVGYLVSGRAQLTTQSGMDRAGEGTLFGVIQPGRPETRRAEETHLWAVTACEVLWLDGAVLRNVCYAACWFHARLIREVDGYFDKTGR